MKEDMEVDLSKIAVSGVTSAAGFKRTSISNTPCSICQDHGEESSVNGSIRLVAFLD
jgi:hypothetical protein